MKIDKKIPIPEPQWPFSRMDVGDSFLLPEGREAAGRQYAIMFGKRHGMKFTSRKTDQGVRIWRME